MKVAAWHWRKYARRRHKPGEAPGLISVAQDAHPTELSLMSYGPEGLGEELYGTDLEQIRARVGKQAVLWVNVDGLGSEENLRGLGEIFDLHPLALEDAVHVPQRPKVEAYGEQLFIVARMVRSGLPLDTEQFSLFIGSDFVITFQERSGDVLDPIRRRLREGRPRWRESGPDYLAYAILDALVDAYFPLLENYGEYLEGLEEEILGDPRPAVVPRLHHLKRDLLNLRRYAWPLREMLSQLSREEYPRISDVSRLHLRDCHDHAVQLLDLVESYRDVGSGLMEFYLSSVSNRMNEVMKVLTIIATLFIPLGFVAGLYGMNFDTSSPWNMPELGWRYGYLFALGAMLLVVLLLLLFFWRKGWIGRPRSRE